MSPRSSSSDPSEAETGATGEAPSAAIGGETSDLDQTRPIGSTISEGVASGVEDSDLVAVGDSVGRYVILRKLGSGGMSHVYVAYDPELNREVAVKVMRPGGPEAKAAAGERLLREAQAMARLEHVNVVRVYDVGIVDGRVWMAMELIRGHDFETWLGHRDRSYREIVAALVRAGRGLAAAHAAGIVHLDFKPRNVLVGDDGEIRVVDFGLARPPRTEDKGPRFDVEASGDSRPVGRLTDQVTEYGLVMGTPGYIAPEQLAGGIADAKTDQFGFCVTLWKALYGRHPFVGNSTSKINAAVLRGDIRPPPSGTRVPARIRRILERGLSRKPSQRFDSLAELIDELERDPLLRWKRAGAVAAALAVAGVAASGYLGREEAGGPACDGAAEQLAPVWNDARRAAVRTAISRDERGFAEETWERVERGLDAWATQWSTMHRDSCEATHKRGEQSQEMLDRRTRCLKDRLHEMSRAVDLLAAADAQIVERATSVVSGLTPIAECADLDGLQREEDLPTDPAQLAELERARDWILRTQVLRNAGKYAEAMVAMTVAAAAAEQCGHPRTTAASRLMYAGLVADYGDADLAVALTFDALLAAEIAEDDERRANALIELLFITGMLQGHIEQSRQYAAMAHAVVDRIGDTGDEEVRLISNEAAVAGAMGDADRSYRLFMRVLEIEEAHPTLARENVSSVYLGVGSALFWMGRYEEALGYYETAEQMLIESLGAHHPRTATAYEDLGTVHHAMGHYEIAYGHFLHALEVSEPSDIAPERLGTLYNGLGAALEGMERLDEAAAWFQKSIDIVDEKGLVLPVLGISLANLGGTRMLQGRVEEAIALYDRAQSVLDETMVEESIWVELLRCQRGYALLRHGEHDAAFEAMIEAIDRLEREQDHDPLYRGECRLAFAEALALTPAHERPPAAVAVARGRTARQWADRAAVDLEAAQPRAKRLMQRLDRLRKRLAP